MTRMSAAEHDRARLTGRGGCRPGVALASIAACLAGGVAAGQAPVVQAPVVQAPVGQAPVGQAPVGQAPVGQAPVGQAPVPAAVREVITTPHWLWEDRHEAGTVKVLFLTSFLAAREPEELTQRFDFDADVVPATANPSGITAGYDEVFLLEALEAKPDVICVAFRGALAHLSDAALDAVERAMKGGATLIACSPSKTPKAWRTTKSASMTDEALACADRNLPVSRVRFPWGRNGDLIGVEAFQVGDGRFVVVGMGHGAGGGFSAFIPSTVKSDSSPAEYEIAYAIFGRLIRWAAGKRGGAECRMRLCSDLMAGTPVEIEAALVGDGSAKDVSIEWEVRSAFGERIDAGAFPVAAVGTGRSRIPLRQAGELTLLYRARRHGELLDSGALSLPVPQPIQVTDLEVPAAIDAGHDVPVTWTLDADDNHGEVEILLQVYDAQDRLVAWKRCPATARECRLDGWVTEGGTHVLRLLASSAEQVILAERRVPLHVRIDRSQDPTRYQVMVWATEKGLVQEQWRYRRLRQLGITALSPVGRNLDVAGMAAAAGLRIAPVNVCVPPGRFRKTFDPAEEAPQLEAYARAVAPLSPVGYSLADEPSDIDLVAFRDWAAGILQREDPGARVGYCGTHMKVGMDLPRILSHCDFMIHYSPHYLYTTDLWRGIERDLHRAFSQENSVNACYTHYAPWRDHEPYSRTMPWLLLFEEANGVSYFASAGGNFTILEPDLRTTHETRWWSEEILELQRGIASQLIAMRRDTGGLAVLLPADLPAAFVGDAQRSVKTWIEALRDMAIPYGFVSPGALSALDPQATPWLVCPASPTLTKPQLDALLRYVGSGGTLLTMGPFAVHESVAVGPAKSVPWEPGVTDSAAEPGRAAVESVSLLDLEPLVGIRREGGASIAPMDLYDRIKMQSGIPCQVSWTPDEAETVHALAGRTSGGPAFVVTGGEVRGTIAPPPEQAPEFVRQALASPGIVRAARGQGLAYHIDFLPDPVSARLLLRTLLDARGGCRPSAEVTIDGVPAPFVYLYPLQGNGTRVLGIIQDHERVAPDRENQDKKTALYQRHGPFLWREQPAMLTLNEPAHLYDVRRGTYLGHGTTASFALRPGRPELFATLPYRVLELIVEGPASVRAGAALPIRLELKAAGEAAVGDHVVHVRLSPPEGSEEAGFATDLLLRGGRGSLAVPTAFNDRAGSWTLRVTDALSGVRAQRPIRVEESAGIVEVLPRARVEVVTEPLAWSQGEWKPYADPASDRLEEVKVRVGTIRRQSTNHGPFAGMECLQAKKLMELRSRKATFGFTYFACNDWKKMEWDDQRRIKANSLSGLGMNEPAGHLWFYNGYLDIFFDDERVTGYRIADVRQVDTTPDGRVDVTWESPAGTATVSFGLRLDGEALLQRLVVRPAVPVETVKVRFRSHIGGFGNSKTRFVLTAAGKNARFTDPAAAPWAFYADDIQDQAYGKGMGAGGILLLPNEWDRVRYGVTGELDKVVALQPGQTAAFHWALWLYADATNEEAFARFSNGRREESDRLAAFFGPLTAAQDTKKLSPPVPGP